MTYINLDIRILHTLMYQVDLCYTDRIDYRDVYYESSFWLGPCEVGTNLAPGGGVPDDGFDGDRARLGVADECCEGLDNAVVSSSPGGTVHAAAEGMEWFQASVVDDGAGAVSDWFQGLGSGSDASLGSHGASEGPGAGIVGAIYAGGGEAK